MRVTPSQRRMICMTATLHPTFGTRPSASHDAAPTRISTKRPATGVEQTTKSQRTRRVAILAVTLLIIALGMIYLSMSHMVGSHSVSGAPVRQVAFSWRTGFDVGYADGTHVSKLLWLRS